MTTRVHLCSQVKAATQMLATNSIYQYILKIKEIFELWKILKWPLSWLIGSPWLNL